MRKWIVSAIGIIGFVMASCSLFLIWFGNAGKTGYINTSEVYNDFKLKKELQEKLDKVLLSRKSILDSLKLTVNLLENKIENSKKISQSDTGRYEFLRSQYLLKEKQFQEDNEALAKKYSEQVWQQLNQYIQDYGKSNNYRFVFGTNGQGNLMYANDASNITEEVKEYVNRRFSGGK